MTIRVVCEAESITLTWEVTATHCRRFTAEDCEDYLDENGCLDTDELEALAAQFEDNGSYDHTNDRVITNISAAGLKVVG